MQDVKQYNNFATTYSDLNKAQNEDSIADYFHLFNSISAGKKILDMGCGAGFDLNFFGAQGLSLYGFDASEEMVKLSKMRNPNAEIKVGRFDEVPFESNYFDFVASKWAIQTADEIDPIYKEVLRVLKTGGEFIFLTGHPVRQFIEKKKSPKDYFKKEMVESIIFNGKIVLKEPTHTMNEYLSDLFLSNFQLLSYREAFENSGEKINGDTYPMYFIFKARKL
jgi:ubiquinone/menaquinone biosynthesis C-methylase UbiE